ncbi:MAG: alcohol dehydrogenase catalytic domain-containing protein [Armatimonadota bacterium]
MASMLVYRGDYGQLSLEEHPCPDPAMGEVRVKLDTALVCSSDLHTIFHRRTAPTPLVLGHETVSVIDRFGLNGPMSDMQGIPLRVGDRVIWSVVASCGGCDVCNRGWPQKCPGATKYGHAMLASHEKWTGGFAEYQVLKPGTGILRVPEHIPSKLAATIGCSTATVCAVMEAAGDVRDKVVLINGAGQLGIQAALMARSSGAHVVVCAESRAERRADANRMGILAIAPESMSLMLPDVTDGALVDTYLELAGHVTDFQQLMQHLAIGGTIVFAGAVFPSPALPLDMEAVIRKCITIKGIHNYRSEHLVRGLAFVSAHVDILLDYLTFGSLLPLKDHARVLQTGESGQYHRVGFTMS